jgi:integrase
MSHPALRPRPDSRSLGHHNAPRVHRCQFAIQSARNQTHQSGGRVGTLGRNILDDLGDRVVSGGLLLCVHHERGPPFTRQSVNYLLAEAAARAGLPPEHPHMLLHSCGFSLANRGYDLRLIQDYLGHCDPKHTVHLHASPPDASRGFGVESGRFNAEGDQTFTVLERWAFLSFMD